MIIDNFNRSKIKSQKKFLEQRIIIYSPQIDGHYLEYIHHIYESGEKKEGASYIFVIPSEFKNKKLMLTWSEQPTVSFDYLTEDECSQCLKSGRLNYYYSAKILARHIKKNKADEAIVLTMVYVMPFICFFLPLLNKCKISGIIYHLYPYSWSRSSIRNKIRTILSYLLFSKSSRIKKIFILNSKSGARFFNRLYKTKRFHYLTDPVNINSSVARNIRRELQIPNNKRIILHFGAMSKAKGSLQLLQAIESSGELLNKYTFIFAGAISDTIKKDFYDIYDKVNKSKVLLYDKFCDYNFLNDLILTCDAIAIPYLNSGQSSGVVALGSYYHKPLIVLREGFVGKLVRDYHLGICLKDSAPDSIIQGILQLESCDLNLEDDKYVREHSVYEFCNQLLS